MMSFPPRITDPRENVDVGGRSSASHEQLQASERARMAAERRALEAEEAATKAMAALAKLEDEKEGLKRKLENKHQKGQTVYIARNPADRDRSLYKIGHSKNVSKRSGNYCTSMPDGVDIVHRVLTSDSHLAERVVHHILDVHRYDANREWFQGDPNFFARVVDCVVEFIDGMVEAGDTIVEHKLDTQLRTLMRRTLDQRPGKESDASGGPTVIIHGDVNVGDLYIGDRDVVSHFLTKCSQVVPGWEVHLDNESKTPASILREAWNEYAAQTGFSTSQKSFKREQFEKHGLEFRVINTCKGCGKAHRAGSCSCTSFSRTNHTTTTIVHGVRVVKVNQ